jgi:Holliday junction resolvasome RuvABC ATP-dependent DNA helicase subunit
MDDELVFYNNKDIQTVIQKRIDVLINDLIDVMNQQIHLHDWGPREVAKRLYKLELYYDYINDEDKELLDLVIEATKRGYKWHFSHTK